MTTFPIALQPNVPRRRYGGRSAALSVSAVLHRALNLVIAAVAIVLTLPLMLLVALAVKLSSPGPVFYTQTRVGRNRRRLLPPGARYRESDFGGKPFTMYKFRTMRASGPDEAAQVWATPDDPRITGVGRYLR